MEEQLEDGRRRVAEAEVVAKKAEEELAVAKERLLLQENELQSKSGTHAQLKACCVSIFLSLLIKLFAYAE